MNNKAIFDNKALNQIKKLVGDSGGGMILVDELPEIGKEDVLYKTPDGKIWSCVNTTTTETVCDLEVGESYKLKNEILAGDIVGLLDKVDDERCFFDISDNKWLETVKNTKGKIFAYNESNPASYAIYNANNVSLTDLVTAELIELTEIPSVEITQLLVDDLANENLILADIAFAFVDGSHTEEITTSTWTEVGGSGSSSGGIQYVNIVGIDDETSVVTLDKTNEEIVEALKLGLVAMKYGDDSNVSYGFIISFSYRDGKIYFNYDISVIPNGELNFDEETGVWSYSLIN